MDFSNKVTFRCKVQKVLARWISPDIFFLDVAKMQAALELLQLKQLWIAYLGTATCFSGL